MVAVDFADREFKSLLGDHVAFLDVIFLRQEPSADRVNLLIVELNAEQIVDLVDEHFAVENVVVWKEAFRRC